MIRLSNNPRLHTFSVEAMNTTFHLYLDVPDRKQAEDAASACFLLLEELEDQLSRYRPDSDITRVNALKTGESVLVTPDTYTCLMEAAAAAQDTAGLFDVTIGSRTLSEPSPQTPLLQGQLEIAPDQPRVTCLQEGRQIDLGGIGKGFALDRLALRLKDFQVDSALLCSGASTLLAIGSEGWPVRLQGDGETLPLELHRGALSASGTGIQGVHVIHPDHSQPTTPVFKRVWLTAPSAAMADAYTTACLIMEPEELKAFQLAREGTVKIFTEAADGSFIQPVDP